MKNTEWLIDGAAAVWLHAHGEVIHDLRMAPRDFERFNQQAG